MMSEFGIRPHRTPLDVPVSLGQDLPQNKHVIEFMLWVGEGNFLQYQNGVLETEVPKIKLHVGVASQLH